MGEEQLQGTSHYLEVQQAGIFLGEGSALELIALKAVFALCILVLQKPLRNSKGRDHIRHLEHPLKLWRDGALYEPVREGQVIQSCLRNKSFMRKETQTTHSFSKLCLRVTSELLYSCWWVVTMVEF